MTTPSRPLTTAGQLSEASRSGNGRNKTDGQIGGSVTSGVHPNRSNDTNPDPVQEMREQARLDHDFAIGESEERPSFTRLGPDRAQLSKPQPSNLNISDAKALGFMEESTPAEPAAAFEPAAEPETTTEAEPTPEAAVEDESTL